MMLMHTCLSVIYRHLSPDLLETFCCQFIFSHLYGLFPFVFSFSIRTSSEVASKVVVHFAPNKLLEFYSLHSTQMYFSSFFKFRQTRMSGYMMEHLLEIYQNKGILSSTILRLVVGTHGVNIEIERPLSCR